MTKEEMLKIAEIAKRADEKGLLMFDRMSLIMDIQAAHEQFNLKLDDLLKADDFDFKHDILGIQQNINRKTKKIENYFLPRYAS
jgi:hypothetical protein